MSARVQGRILVVDDEASMCEMLAERLGVLGFDVVWRTSAEEALDLLATEDVDVVVTDVNMTSMNGLELCQRVVANRPDVSVIVITAFGSLETAIAAIRAGAYDFITKPFDVKALAIALERAIERRGLRDEVQRLKVAVRETGRFGSLLGASPAMQRVHAMLEQLGGVDAAVLVTGESGTGKELIARALHERSRRKDGPFVPVNCAAIPEALLESELFGHARGAFTDARTAHPGLFRQAHGGTLFLDEVGELPLTLQPKLLRALQERTARPVGGQAEVPFDVRLVCASNRDLETAVERGTFREDLYFRVNVVQVPLPPLRARGGDVLLLAQHFLVRFAAQADKPITGLSPAVAERLLAYPWPGNVRELQNCIERAVALGRFAEITVDDLPEKIRAWTPSHVLVAGHDPTDLVPLDAVERRYILQVMDAVGGNKTLAAQVLGTGRKTLYRKLAEYGVGGDAGDQGE